jgi:CTP synthase
LFCNVTPEAVFECRDVETIYQLPLELYGEGVDEKIAEQLNIWSRAPRLENWEKIVSTVQEPRSAVTIGVVGKYVELIESYKSLNEALTHGGIANGGRVEVRYIDSEEIEAQGCDELLAGLDGILIPGGFGGRGTEGKIRAIRHARENEVPFFGICLGLQMAVVEFARNVAGLEGANSVECDADSPHPVIHLMEHQRGLEEKGGTMRLGAYPCKLTPRTVAAEAYGAREVSERHRHRLEVNNSYREQLAAAGLVFSGLSPDDLLVEMIELPSHPYFVGCQFHPEFKSRPTNAHPLFTRFIRAALTAQKSRPKPASPPEGSTEGEGEGQDRPEPLALHSS